VNITLFSKCLCAQCKVSNVQIATQASQSNKSNRVKILWNGNKFDAISAELFISSYY